MLFRKYNVIILTRNSVSQSPAKNHDSIKSAGLVSPKLSEPSLAEVSANKASPKPTDTINF